VEIVSRNLRLFAWVLVQNGNRDAIGFVIVAEVIVKKDSLTNALLGVIAMALIVIAARPYVSPVPVAADSSPAHAFYIEPGVQNLRYPDGTGQVYGKIVVDLKSGKIWGFPTGTVDPYPSYPLDSKPTVSKPFALGRYAFEDTEK
jgi:hypothetical protein